MSSEGWLDVRVNLLGPLMARLFLAMVPAMLPVGGTALAQQDLLERCADDRLSYDLRHAACSDYAVDDRNPVEARSVALALRAFAAFDAGKTAIGYVDATLALELFPNNGLALAARGWSHIGAGRFDEARGDFYAAGRYDSEKAHLQSNLGLSALAWEFESFALTRQLASAVLDADPSHAHALYLRGASAGAVGDFTDAFADAATLIEAYPSDPIGYELKGLLHHTRALGDGGKSDYAAGLRAYETAMDLSEAPTASLLRRYSWLLGTGPTEFRNPGLALELAQRMRKQVGGVKRHLAVAHHTLAVALAANGRVRDAEIELDAMIEVFPGARSRLQKALAAAGYLKKTPSATLYELIGAIHACLEASCTALSVPLIYKTL